MKKFEGDFLKCKYWSNNEFREAVDVLACRMKNCIISPENISDDYIKNVLIEF